MSEKKQKRIALTGGAAAAEALKQIEPDVMPVYPITPQTPIIETYAKFHADGEVDTEIIQVESEHSAISAAVGASAAGARTVTATSSQGLALMNEILYIASGMRLPILMVVSARALSAPINIHGDHSDVMGARDAGWIQLFSENAQEAYDNTIIGMKLAEKAGLPVMVIMDGFNTSHSVENLEIMSKDEVQKFVGEYQPEKYLLNVDDPVTFGPLALQNSYFEFKVDQEKAMEAAKEIYLEIKNEYKKLKDPSTSSGQENYFETYQTDDAEQIIVLAGSTAGTAKDVIDNLRKKDKKAGLLKLNLFRPFPSAEIINAIKNAKGIAVMERSISSGTYSPIYQDIVSGFYDADTRPNIQPYIYSLGGRDIFAADIEKVFRDLEMENIGKEIKYIGINE